MQTQIQIQIQTDDVLRARLKTVGVSEHRFHMEAAAGRESGTEWRIVDVGGSRSQRRESFGFFLWMCLLMTQWDLFVLGVICVADGGCSEMDTVL